MAQDLDEFPLDDPLVKKNGFISDSWRAVMSAFYMNLIGYLSQNGVFLPQLTTAQRDQILSPQNGQMIYNTTLDTAQYVKAGVWTSF